MKRITSSGWGGVETWIVAVKKERRKKLSRKLYSKGIRFMFNRRKSQGEKVSFLFALLTNPSMIHLFSSFLLWYITFVFILSKWQVRKIRLWSCGWEAGFDWIFMVLVTYSTFVNNFNLFNGFWEFKFFCSIFMWHHFCLKTGKADFCA